ncbi:MAG: hypothetical protein AB8B50_17765 [Pirellulaceae bacterium]
MDFEKDKTSDADWKAWAAHKVVIPWTEAMIKLRIPLGTDPRNGPVALKPINLEKGWLADLRKKKFAPFNEFGGSDAETSWFPNEMVAKAWASFSLSDHER